jgi:hypothetical protein
MSTAAADESGHLDLDVLASGISAEMRRFLAEVLPSELRAILGGEPRTQRLASCPGYQGAQGMLLAGLWGPRCCSWTRAAGCVGSGCNP